MDRVVHGTGADGTVRLIAAVTTDTVAEAFQLDEDDLKGTLNNENA